jgi:putative acetyltransferase
MTFRHATLEDLPAMKELYAGTIRSVCKADYTEEQTAMWASSVNKEERWLGVVVNQFVLLAEIDHELVGFGTLRDHNYIDFFYVHKDFQGMGIARELLNRLLDEAMSHGVKLVSSDISITAKPFFRKNGFKVVAEQKNVRQDVILINYKMIRYLPGPDMDPEIKSIYAIEDIFKITGRGLILAGRVVEGNINIFTGDHIEFMALDRLRRRRIKSVELFSGSHVDFSKIGLLIQCENQEELEELRAWKPFNEIARIYNAEANPS